MQARALDGIAIQCSLKLTLSHGGRGRFVDCSSIATHFPTIDVQDHCETANSLATSLFPGVEAFGIEHERLYPGRVSSAVPILRIAPALVTPSFKPLPSSLREGFCS
jgi:hypothetical protein